MKGRSPLSPAGRLYVALIVVLGSAAIAAAVREVCLGDLHWFWGILAAFTLVSGTLTVKVPSISARLSVSETFVFAAVLFYGTGPGTLIVALDGLIISLWTSKGRLHRILFNTAEPALSIWIASHVFFFAAGPPPFNLPRPAIPLLSSLIAFAALYFTLNSALTAIALAIETGKKPVAVWRQHFFWLSLNYFAGASVALLLARSGSRYPDPIAFAVILPLLVVSYLTYKTALDRISDANRHIAELNSLYLSTIETLAMAIDAKDQITHGHIRRVQTYAVGLAKTLGVTDEVHIRAIEAAALLHDMGKLAVPEYILNKPGKLTNAEFEKIKLHASVGADILSAIDFPYPVVPIVRHHHENWDGTGYPDGLRGDGIPIGARILSVVDCFDALTSDRPYRPRLPDSDAFRILAERRGTMYDSKVVDTFLAVYRHVEENANGDEIRPIPRERLCAPAVPIAPEGGRIKAPLHDIAASGEEMLTLFELARALGGRADFEDTADMIAKHLGKLIPHSLCCFYLCDPESDLLSVAHTVPAEGKEVLRGTAIQLGQGIAGWVAANRQPIVNADAHLDLGNKFRGVVPEPCACLSVPLLCGELLVGVICLYSPVKGCFTDDHRRILDVAAPQIASAIHESAVREAGRMAALRDGLTGLPNRQRLWQVFASGGFAEPRIRPVTLLFLRVLGCDHGNDDTTSADETHELVANVAKTIRTGLRAGDMLFHWNVGEFLVLLAQTDSGTAIDVGERVRFRLNGTHSSAPNVKHEILIGAATTPDDGESLSDLIEQARGRAGHAAGHGQATTVLLGQRALY
jgi:diguanylate cyclase (GGDEF)-like protein/putative nucleotidyltransferase with HDIG domain